MRVESYKYGFGRVVHVHIQVNEHENTNMFMFVIIYVTNVFKDNHIFLFRCLHRSLVTSRTIIDKMTNRNSHNKSNTFFLI